MNVVLQHHKALYLAKKLKTKRYNFKSFGNFAPERKNTTLYFSQNDNFQPKSKKQLANEQRHRRQSQSSLDMNLLGANSKFNVMNKSVNCVFDFEGKKKELDIDYTHEGEAFLDLPDSEGDNTSQVKSKGQLKSEQRKA